MRVKILESNRYWDLEDKVNEYLKRFPTEKIIDIKYSGNGNHAPYSTDYYSVMIILKD